MRTGDETDASRPGRPAGVPDRVHVIGVGGAHMSAIARVLRAWGCTVTGSDQTTTTMTESLIAEGIKVSIGHAAENVGEAELVTYTSAVKPGHVELAEAERLGIPAIKRHEMVALMMEGYYSIAVTGTHGKTTTSGLMAHILVEAGLDPTYLIGGEVRSLGTNAAVGRGRYFVVEADEYDYAFLSYHPDLAIVTNVEADHLDLFATLERLNDSFRQFMSQVKPDGHLVTCADHAGLHDVLMKTAIAARDHQTYGFTAAADWRAKHVVQGEQQQRFDVEHRGESLGTFETTLPGAHNVSNVLAGIAASAAIGLAPDTVRSAVASFRGARRRFELVGEVAGVTLIDDYAHHPTEVRANLRAARERFGRRRLVLLFQPHTFSRSQYLFDQWTTSFEDADDLYLAPTFRARGESPELGVTTEQLADAITKPRAIACATMDDAVRRVASGLREGDLVFTMGAGDVDRAGPLILDELRRRFEHTHA